MGDVPPPGRKAAGVIDSTRPGPTSIPGPPVSQILDENPVPLSQARTYLTGRGSKHPDAETLRAWVKVGIQTPIGRIKLGAVMVGGVWQTSKAAVVRFTEA